MKVDQAAFDIGQMAERMAEQSTRGRIFKGVLPNWILHSKDTARRSRNQIVLVLGKGLALLNCQAFDSCAQRLCCSL